jgi:outer membrane protein assembly factor BamB
MKAVQLIRKNICFIFLVLSWVLAPGIASALEADIYEVDNTAAQALARAALNDGAQTHTIHLTNDIDYVHFSVLSGHTYSIETTCLDASMDTYMYLIGTNGTTMLAENDDGGPGRGSLISYKFDTPGTYYSLIEHYELNHGSGVGTGTYSIALTDIGPEGTPGTWKWRLPVASMSSPAIGADGKIYIGANIGALYAMNPDGTTARVWNTAAPIQYASPSIAADGKVYLGASDGTLYAFNSDGTTGLTWNTGHYILSAPAIGANGTIYVTSFSSNLYAFNPDGTTGHVWNTRGSIYASPAIDNSGLIYVGSADSNLYCFNPDGTTARTWQVDGMIQWSSPAIDTNGVIYACATSGKLYGFNPNGTTSHVWNTSGDIYASPVIDANGLIYVSSFDGSYAFNPDGTTSRTWYCTVLSAGIVCRDGSVIVCGRKHYSLNPNGTTNWAFNLENMLPGGSALDTNGMLYSVANGNLSAIYATGSMAQTAWPKFQHDLKNTGKVAPLAPTNVFASDGLYNNRIALGWTPVNSASSYDILRGTNSSYASAQARAQEVAATNYADSSVMAGITYYYWVLSRDNSGASVPPGASDTGWQHCLASSAAGDYDRDGLADPADYNLTNGTWKVKFSSGNYALATAENLLGGSGYTAVTADYDGDGLADPSVYDEATGSWLVKLSSANYTQITLTGFLGAQGHSALAADYDGDRLADPAIYNEATGDWTFKLSSPVSGQTYRVVVLPQLIGGQGWYPLIADFDGDRFADPAAYEEPTGSWAVLLSSAGYYLIQLDGLLGGPGYIPVPADYDGDGLADPAVKSTSGDEWIVMFSASGYTPVQLTIAFE